LTAAIGQAMGAGLRGSFEAEVLQDATERAGGLFTDRSFTVPWELLAPQRRDLNASSTGWPLVATGVADAVDVLQPFSVVANLCDVLPNQKGNVTIPRVTSGATAHWLASELDPAGESQPVIGQISCSPRAVAAVVPYSFQFRRQAVPEGMLQAHLLRTLGRALDVAVLAGSGASGEPAGLSVTPGVTAVSGASLDWADVQTMRKTTRDADGDDAATAWVSATDAAELLGKRERASGNGGFIFDNGLCDGRPVHAVSTAPAGTLYFGDWRTVAVLLWGALQISVNPFDGFNVGTSALRVTLHADVVARAPQTFCIASSIT
jgi:HK97 family phage major capsid protein